MVSIMDIEERMNLVREVGEEIVSEEELKELLLTKKDLVAYDGFEPSGNLHIAQGLLRTININKMIKAGFKFKMFVADWHGWANNKMEGDLEKIQVVGRYQIEIWKACGMDLENVDFIWGSELVKDEEYWMKVMKIAINSTLKRIIRCSQIMGRGESESLQASQILYPCMQAADIFHLGADVCQLGMDQRKVNMLAREIGPKLGWWKPVVVSHHMMMGLLPPKDKEYEDLMDKTIDMKMSKSKPDSAIFMTDSEDEIKRKIKKAYCPEGQVDENPMMEYSKYIIFEKFDEFTVKRPEKFGGDLTFSSYKELADAYTKKELHPLDLKTAVVEYINELIQPVREHFEKNEEAKKLLEQFRGFEITR